MRKTGFTLFEILIALIILSIAITGMLGLYTSTKRFLLHGRSTFTGTGLVGKVFLDPLQLDVRQDEWLNRCLGSNPTLGCPASQPVDTITYTPTWTIDDVAGTSLRRVRLSLSWVEPNP